MNPVRFDTRSSFCSPRLLKPTPDDVEVHAAYICLPPPPPDPEDEDEGVFDALFDDPAQGEEKRKL